VADALTAVLDSLRIDSGLYCRAEQHAPWGVRFPAAGTPMFHVVDAGHCWLSCAVAAAPVELHAGDLVMLPHGDGHTVLSSLDSEVGAVVTLAETEHRSPCLVLTDGLAGESAGVATTLVCGTIRFRRMGDWLFGLLPPVLHVPAGGPEAVRLRPVLDLLAEESAVPRPGGSTMVSRLCDILVVEVLRGWIAGAAPPGTGWLAGLRDPQIAVALGQIHTAPERAWTVHALARAAGMSRSRFALRFAELVGVTPLQYLTDWRLCHACALLDDPGHSLRAVAQRCGYGSEAAFGKAFKRRFGVSPGAYRRDGRGAGGTAGRDA
jgi:AraC-like DNA-binding protein